MGQSYRTLLLIRSSLGRKKMGRCQLFPPGVDPGSNTTNGREGEPFPRGLGNSKHLSLCLIPLYLIRLTPGVELGLYAVARRDHAHPLPRPAFGEANEKLDN